MLRDIAGISQNRAAATRLTSGAAAREIAAAKKAFAILAGRTVSRRWPTAISPPGTHKHGCKLESDDRRGRTSLSRAHQDGSTRWWLRQAADRHQRLAGRELRRRHPARKKLTVS